MILRTVENERETPLLVHPKKSKKILESVEKGKLLYTFISTDCIDTQILLRIDKENEWFTLADLDAWGLDELSPHGWFLTKKETQTPLYGALYTVVTPEQYTEGILFQVYNPTDHRIKIVKYILRRFVATGD